ncbi:MAG: universal stress protein [Gloeobacteraceae cyanobacterium ES-bin-316]|nr:universal stress protein [Ferruginibacter sp.]
MKKILVPTDFSEKSKAAFLFAIQLASQDNYKLTFLHVLHIPTPIAWNVVRIDEYEKGQIIAAEARLNIFVENVYAGLNIPLSNVECIVKSSLFPEAVIGEYAEKNLFDFICISTRGAGTLHRILGTNTGNLINHSAIPVIAVPHLYKTTAITSILYASDLDHYEKEISRVIAFAKPLKATLELLHLTTVLENTAELMDIEKAVAKIDAYNVEFSLIPRDPSESLITDIETAIEKTKPSMMVMFTEQNRSWIDKIFLSSKSAEYSFDAKVPLLAFNKS